MKMKSTMMAMITLVALLLVGAGVQADTINMYTLNWTVAYKISNNIASPDDNRGLALDPTGQYMYVGYNNSSTTMTVNKIQLSTGNVVASKSGIRGKSIAVDDIGRVYTTGINGEGIFIYSSDLSSTLYSITMTKTEGLTVRREGAALVLYATERNNPDLYRWVLTESGGGITANTAAGLGGTGHILVTGASDLRGVAVDTSGRIWLAGASQGKVWRMNSDGTGLTSTSVSNPYYFGISGDQVFVTQWENRKVAVLNADTMAVTHTIGGDIAIPWLDLGLDADGAGDPRNGLVGTNGAITGIAMLPSGTGFYLTNERGVSLDGNYREAVLSVNVPEQVPTAITLASFEAKPGNNKVTLKWVTATEIDNAGFNILRAESENGEYVQINESLIPAQGTATQGSSYVFVDTEVANRMTYYYKLQDIDLNGTATMHGPESATPRLIFGMGK